MGEMPSYMEKLAVLQEQVTECHKQNYMADTSRALGMVISLHVAQIEATQDEIVERLKALEERQ